MNNDELLLDYTTATHWRTVDLLYDGILASRRIECPLCGYGDNRAGYRLHVSECRFNGGRLERYACPSCDVVFGPLKMLDLSAQQLHMEYRALYARYEEADSTAAETRAFHACRPQAGGIYLNWGCGRWSKTIDQLRADGWDVWGYDPMVEPTSPFVVNRQDELSARFDGIFSNNMIEHLPDPVGELRRMRRRLADSGLMAHGSPCFDLLYEDSRFHLFFYLGRSVELMAERSGFEVVGTQRDGEYIDVVFRART